MKNLEGEGRNTDGGSGGKSPDDLAAYLEHLRLQNELNQAILKHKRKEGK